MAESSIYFFVNMSFWASVMCQEETSESLEGVFPSGVINRGKNLLKDLSRCINCEGHQSFLEPDK